MDDLFGVGAEELLEVGTFGLGEAMGQPEDLGRGVGFLLYDLWGRLELLPHSDDHEGHQNGVDDAQCGVDESSNVVVWSSGVGGYEALHQLEPGERDEANRPDHEHTRYYCE
jgi:hypothetical protein